MCQDILNTKTYPLFECFHIVVKNDTSRMGQLCGGVFSKCTGLDGIQFQGGVACYQ